MEKTLTVREHGFAGIFCEGSLEPDKAVIYVGGGGSTGKETVQAAAFIREAGFNLLILGYYGWPETPQKMEGIPVEYAETAVRYLKEERGINRILMAGASEGAVFALLCASKIPEIRAVCAVTPMDFVMTSPMAKGHVSSVYTWRGEAVPFTEFSPRKIGLFRILKGALTNREYGFRRIIRYACDCVKPKENTRIRVEEMQAELLMIVPSFDDIWGSEEAAKRIRERLEKAEYPYPVHIAVCRSGSHLMGGSYDLSGTGMKIFRHLLKAEHEYPRECENARHICMERILQFIRES